MIDCMKTFRAVVENKGFRAAAPVLNLSVSMISRRVEKLEHQLKTRLINRNSRAFSLTSIGSHFYQKSVSILESMEQCIKEVENLSGETNGRLKVGIPTSICYNYFTPAIRNFSQTYPDLTLEIVSGNHFSEMFTHNYDLAIHCGPLPDMDIYFTLLGYWEKKLCASPDYLKRFGTPTKPDQLTNHNCLVHYDNIRENWAFTVQNKLIDIKVSGSIRINSSLDLCKMAEQGEGLVYLPDFTVHDSICKGNLVSIMSEYMPPTLPMYIVHINKTPSLKEQAFINYLRSLNLTKTT